MTPAQATVQRILEEGARAGREKLGALAYQMARSCLSKAETEYAHAERWFEAPRGVADLGRDMNHLQARTHTDLDQSELPRANPSSASAVRTARSCIRVVEALEGSSTRVKYLRASVAKTEGDYEQAVRHLEHMRDAPLSKKWLGYVHEVQQAMYLRSGRYEQVLKLGQERLRLGPSRLALVNMATAHAWMGDEDGVDHCIDQFKASDEPLPDLGWWRQFLGAESSWFGEQLGREPQDVFASFALPDDPGGGA